MHKEDVQGRSIQKQASMLSGVFEVILETQHYRPCEISNLHQAMETDSGKHWIK